MSELFLTRFVLDPLNNAVQRDLADCHALHQRFMQAFPTARSDSPRAEFGLLYRIELGGRQRSTPALLLQSETRGNWDVLPNGYLVDDLSDINPAVKEIGVRYDRIQNGDQFQFRLRANPTRRVLKPRKSDHDSMIGKRVQLFTDEERREWMKRKGEQGGFAVDLDALQIGKGDVFGPRQYGNRGSGDRRERLTFEAAVFDGMLQVTDAERFRATLRTGIGSGKAYGFGLLSIAPPSALP